MFSNHLINDLAWAIRSPPMIVLAQSPCFWYDSGFYNDVFNASSAWFNQLECDSKKLQETINAQKDKRLGNYFETLWASWIDASERFELIERNLQIFDNGKTLGELDFIVLDRSSDKVLHWELAVKFYLGTGDTRLHKNWYGPAKKDRLDLKLNHLINRQTVLCQQEATKKVLKSKNIKVDSTAVILKGCLFYPADNENSLPPHDANKNHCRSRWMKFPELGSHFHRDERFYPLIGEGWMASLDTLKLNQALCLQAFIKSIENSQYRLPVLVSVVKNGIETEKVFVVQQDWDK